MTSGGWQPDEHFSEGWIEQAAELTPEQQAREIEHQVWQAEQNAAALGDEEHVGTTAQLLHTAIGESEFLQAALASGEMDIDTLSQMASMVVSHEVTDRNWGAGIAAGQAALKLLPPDITGEY